MPPPGRLVIFESINPLLNSKQHTDKNVDLPGFLGSFVAPSSPSSSPKAVDTSLVLIYHQDMPTAPSTQVYAPSPLPILVYLATTIIKVHSFSHILAQKASIDRSLGAPLFGLEQGQDGVLLGRLDNEKLGRGEGIVLEMEHRRKSGRGVVEWYLLPRVPQQQVGEVIMLLDDHPLYRPLQEQVPVGAGEGPESTFELRLTDRQRREREGVVLPYFDAQHGDGPGEGGRILYDMGEEDDFDEEEDEI